MESIVMQDYSENRSMPEAIRRTPNMKRLLPAFVPLCAFSIDLTGWLDFSLIPVACVFALVIFSFVLSSRQMIGWTVVYILAISGTLWMRREIWSGSHGNADALVATRASVAAAAGILACLLARRRELDSITEKAIHRLLDQMEVPVVTSDQDGWLVHMNPHASQLLGGKLALQSPFFEHFSSSAAKGVAIRNYVDLATGATTGPLSMELALSPDRSRIHAATMLSVDIGERRQVLTLLFPQKSDIPSTQPIPND